MVLFAIAAVATLGVGAAAIIGRGLYREHAARASYERATIAYADGRYAEALPDFSIYLSRHPDDLEALLMFADTRIHIPEVDFGHQRTALKLYLYALEIEPGNLRALEGLLELYRQTGRRIELADRAKQIIAIDSNHTAALRAMVGSDLAVGAFESATQYAQRLCQIEPDRYDYRELYMLVRTRAGDRADALVAYCDSLVDANPDADGRWLLLRGNTRLRFRDLAGGRDDLLAAAKRGVDRDLFDGLLWDLDGIDERDAAEALLDAARIEHADEVWPYMLAVRREWVHGRLNEAVAAIDTGLREINGVEQAPLLRWQALLAAVNDDRDLADLALVRLEALSDEATAAEREHSSAWTEAIRARLEVGATRWNEAVTHFQMAIGRMASMVDDRSIRIDRSVLHYLYGEALIELGETEDASRQFQLAYEDSQRQWVVAGASYADAERLAGHLLNAVQISVDVVIRTSPSIARPWIVLGQSWLELERSGMSAAAAGQRWPWTDALAYLNWAYEASDESDEMFLLLIQGHLLHNDTAIAIAMIEKAALRDDLPPPMAIQLARLASVSDQDELANRILQPVNPSSDAEGLQIAILRAQLKAHGGDAAGGLALLRAVPNEHPNLTPEQWNLACLQFSVEYELAAQEEFQRALIEGPVLSVDAARYLLSLKKERLTEDSAQQIVDRMKKLLKPSASQLLVAEAQVLLQYHPDDQEQISRAISRLDGLNEWNRNSLVVLTTVANLYLAGSDPDVRAASRWLQTAVDRYPHQLALYPKLISLLQDRGEVSSASRYLNQLRSRRGEGVDTRATSILLARQGDFESAIQSLSEVIDDRSAETDQLLLASWQWRAGRYAQADRIFHDLLQREMPGPLVLQFAARFYATRGELERGLELLRTAPLEQESVRSLLVGSFFYQIGDRDAAARELLQAVNENPENAGALLAMGRIHLEREEPEQAIEFARRGLEIEPQNKDLRLLVAAGGLNGSDANRRSAIDVFRELHGDNRALIATIEFFIDVTTGSGSSRQKEIDLERARQLVRENPTFLPMVRLATTMHAQAGQVSEALRLAEVASARMPDQAEPAEWMTQLLIDMWRLPEAWDAAIMWRQRSLDDPLPACRALASIALDRRVPRQALDVLSPLARRIERQRERDPKLYELWVVTLLMNDRVEEAFDLVREGIAQDEFTFSRWLQIVRMLAGDTAITALEHAAAYASTTRRRLDMAVAWADLGSRLDRDGFPQAAESFQRAEALARAPALEEDFEESVQVCLAIIAAARHDDERALTLYLGVLEQNPDHSIALNNIAMLLSARLQRPREALKFSTMLVEAYPDAPSFQDTHAQVLLQLDRLDEANGLIDVALGEAPDRPAMLVTKGRILLARGDADRAAEILDRAEQVMRRSLIRSTETEEALDAARALLDSSS